MRAAASACERRPAGDGARLRVAEVCGRGGGGARTSDLGAQRVEGELEKAARAVELARVPNRRLDLQKGGCACRGAAGLAGRRERARPEAIDGGGARLGGEAREHRVEGRRETAKERVVGLEQHRRLERLGGERVALREQRVGRRGAGVAGAMTAGALELAERLSEGRSGAREPEVSVARPSTVSWRKIYRDGQKSENFEKGR